MTMADRIENVRVWHVGRTAELLDSIVLRWCAFVTAGGLARPLCTGYDSRHPDDTLADLVDSIDCGVDGCGVEMLQVGPDHSELAVFAAQHIEVVRIVVLDGFLQKKLGDTDGGGRLDSEGLRIKPVAVPLAAGTGWRQPAVARVVFTHDEKRRDTMLVHDDETRGAVLAMRLTRCRTGKEVTRDAALALRGLDAPHWR